MTLPMHGASPFSVLGALVDDNAAREAADRLYNRSEQGIRFYCENREVLSADEARRRDEAEAARQGRRGGRARRDALPIAAPGTARFDTTPFDAEDNALDYA